ncbi:MAG TPA: histidine kinase [Methylophilaceae bacterium]|jgi:two-component system sensor histidine kinase AlgZ
MISIKQNRNISVRPAGRLPDLHNLGVSLRILLLVNLLAVIAAILLSPNLKDALRELTELSALIQPILLASLLLLYLAYPLLQKMPYFLATACIMLLELMLTSAAHYIGLSIFGLDSMPVLSRSWLLTLIVTSVVLYYFNLRHKALTPAITEARLQALQARIRPHFLFNSINAVLSLVRSDPKRAEVALEDMADLFRVLMADNRDLVPLAQELGLSRQYLALEKLRLEERLNVVWQIDNMPPDALIPPLVLQPLLENAVYHGIEPMAEGGEININIYANRDQVHLVLSNPYHKQNEHYGGNKMALTNIRERLALHFDAEASLTSRVTENRYEVHIVIPYHQQISI